MASATKCRIYYISEYFFKMFFFIFQNHEWIRKADAEKVDIAGWVCKTMDLMPSTPNSNVSPFSS